MASGDSFLLQKKITETNKLNADLVDSTSSTNKFVTLGDITNWNQKANRPSSPVADEVATLTADGDLVSGGKKLTDLIKYTDVVNNTSTTTTNVPLSANMGKELQDEINNLKAIGRFLSLWNCTTGLPTTDPTTSPYTYHTGDYYIVSVVSSASPAVNYKPDGSTYTIGQASTVQETNTVLVNDYYVYDGTIWKLVSNTQRTVTFANIAGEPEDNANLAAALNEKVDKTIKVNDHPLSSNVTVTKTDIGLSNVDNKSEATIKTDFTGSVASGNTGFPTGGDVYTAIESHTPSDMTGATESAAGTHGLVPAPAAGDQNKYLQGNGTWTTVDALPSQSGQIGKYLTTNGTTASWANVIVSNTSFGTFVTDATNTSYTYNHGLNTQAVMVLISNSSYETIQVDVTRTNNNTVTIEFATAPGVGTYNIYCVAPTTTTATSGEEVYY